MPGYRGGFVAPGLASHIGGREQSQCHHYLFFFFQAEDGIRDHCVTGVQTCALPICQVSGSIQNTETQVHPTAACALLVPKATAQLAGACGYGCERWSSRCAPPGGNENATSQVYEKWRVVGGTGLEPVTSSV